MFYLMPPEFGFLVISGLVIWLIVAGIKSLARRDGSSLEQRKAIMEADKAYRERIKEENNNKLFRKRTRPITVGEVLFQVFFWVGYIALVVWLTVRCG